MVGGIVVLSVSTRASVQVQCHALNRNGYGGMLTVEVSINNSADKMWGREYTIKLLAVPLRFVSALHFCCYPAPPASLSFCTSLPCISCHEFVKQSCSSVDFPQ